MRLIHRTTLTVLMVTEVGQTFYQHCKAMLIEAEAAQQAVETLRSEPRGSVKLTCPVTFITCAYRTNAGAVLCCVTLG